jgi:hypothetical protein
MKKNNKIIPRRAIEQYEACKKIKQKNVAGFWNDNDESLHQFLQS